MIRPKTRARWVHLLLALAFSLVFMAAECELEKHDRQVLVDFFTSWAFDAMLSGSAGAKDVKNAMDVKDAYDRVTAEQNADRANKLAARGDKQGALELLDEAIKLDDKPDYRLRRARLLKETGQHEKALEDYDKFLASGKVDPKDPDLAQLYQERAQSRNASKDYRGAVDDLNKAVRIAGEVPELLAQRAAAKQNAGDVAGAKSDLDRAVQADRNNPDVLRQRAEINRVLGNKQDAISDYDRAAQNITGQSKKDADRVQDLLRQKFYLQSQSGDRAGAAATAEAMEKAYKDRKLDPPAQVYADQDGAYRALAAATNDPAQRTAALDRSIAALGKAAEREPSYLWWQAGALNERALTTQDAGQRGRDLQRAYETADRFVKHDPGAAGGYLERGNAVYNANYSGGRPSAAAYADAIKDFKQAADIATPKPGEYRSVFYTTDFVERANGKLGDASFNRGELTGSRADFERAREAYQQAITVNPNNPYNHSVLAQTYDKLGEPEKAAAARGRANQLRREGRPPS